MKNSILILILAVSSSTVFAVGAQRTCPKNILTCKLEKQLSSGGKSLVNSTVSEFDGTNSDEPSVPPDSCVIRTSLEDHNGVILNVNIDENDLMAGIHSVKRPNLGTLLPGDTAFAVKTGTQFYYRYNDSLLTCSLSK